MADVDIEKKIEQVEVLLKQLSEEIMSLTSVVKSSMEVQKAMVEVIRKQVDTEPTVDMDEHEEKTKDLANEMEQRESDEKEPAEEPKPSLPPADDGVSHEEEADIAKSVETPTPNSDEGVKSGIEVEEMDDFAKALGKVLRREIDIKEFMKLV